MSGMPGLVGNSFIIASSLLIVPVNGKVKIRLSL
jgi:hypothetical protein